VKERRSASQVLFGFLPEQTVDLRGGVWRVARWRQPIPQRSMDVGTLVRELKRQASAWRDAGKDGGFVNDLERGHAVRVYSLDREAGVQVDPFPRIWHCKRCRRLTNDPGARCECGSTASPGQIPFVGYCSECGTLRQPYIKKCPEHGQHRVNWPGTSSAREILFDCPVCSRKLQEGLGMPNCECGQGRITFSVHRAASVYTPRNVVIVNPPSLERIREIAEAGGPPRALAWVIDGMRTRRVGESPTPRESIRRQLSSSGLSIEQIEQMLKVLDSTGRDSEQITEVCLENPDEAERQAVSIALATSESRMTVNDLKDGTADDTQMARLYDFSYPTAMNRAGVETVELIDRFPVMTGMFGYTRGNPSPGASRLVPFREAGGYAVYADLAETEALFVRLDPFRVAEWLRCHGSPVAHPDTATETRIEILRLATRADAEGQVASQHLFALIHSYCHRLIRLTAVFGGIERNALSELVAPLHLGFFIYAAARGDFVLGGLQALFETELDGLLRTFADDDHRCPLDPGCSHGGGACMACLHLGEPSCRHYNSNLSRSTLAGENGYLHLE
jgi:hypothetical protein